MTVAYMVRTGSQNQEHQQNQKAKSKLLTNYKNKKMKSLIGNYKGVDVYFNANSEEFTFKIKGSWFVKPSFAAAKTHINAYKQSEILKPFQAVRLVDCFGNFDRIEKIKITGYKRKRFYYVDQEGEYAHQLYSNLDNVFIYSEKIDSHLDRINELIKMKEEYCDKINKMIEDEATKIPTPSLQKFEQDLN